MIAKKCLLSFTTFYGVPLYYLLWAQDLPRAQLLVALQIVTYSVRFISVSRQNE